MYGVIFLAGLIFFFIIVILIIYFVYYNRTEPPEAEITTFGITLHSTNNEYITLETIFSIPIPNSSEPTLVLQGIPLDDYPSSSQSWNLVNASTGDRIHYLGNKPDPDAPVTNPGTLVYLSSNLLDASVVVDTTTTPITLTATSPDNPGMNSQFYLEYEAGTPNIIQLKSTLPQISGKDQYLIPGPAIGSPEGAVARSVTIGVPTNGNNSWFVNS